MEKERNERKERNDRLTGPAIALAAGSWLLSVVIGLLAAVLIAYSGYVLYDTFYTENRAIADSVDLLQFRPSVLDEHSDYYSDPIDLLSEVNPDYRAWLTVHETRIDYPIVQGPDDLYYAYHDAYGDVSISGAIYLAAANASDFSDNYNLIYGHHMDNGAMFGTLDAFRDKDYFDEHRTGAIAVGNTVYDVTLFAVVETNAYDNEIYNVGNRDLAQLLAYVETVSVHFDHEPLEGATKIVALSTCAGATTDGRLLVYGVMTERKGPPATPEPEATPTPRPTPRPTATPEPTSEPMDRFTPRGNTRGRRVWSLVDLICTICTVYLFLPLFRLKAKFSRPKRLRRIGKKGFAHKFRIGLVFELIFAVGIVLLFIYTQDLRTPMVLIDRWTPLFLLIHALSWLTDFILIRYRGETCPDDWIWHFDVKGAGFGVTDLVFHNRSLAGMIGVVLEFVQPFAAEPTEAPQVSINGIPLVRFGEGAPTTPKTSAGGRRVGYEMEGVSAVNLPETFELTVTYRGETVQTTLHKSDALRKPEAQKEFDYGALFTYPEEPQA